MNELMQFPLPSIEAIQVMLISCVLFVPAVCIVKMFEAMIEITSGAYSTDHPERSRRR